MYEDRSIITDKTMGISVKNIGLKINILKTLGLNIKNLTPLAMKGLNAMASLPAATIGMVLQTTPANADEANMQLEDFAKLNEKNSNPDDISKTNIFKGPL